jgi:hypothetical protein
MKVGFVGLGHMAASMAASLLKAGHDVTVDNRTRMKVDALVAEGAKDAVITKKLDFLICQDARQEAGGTIALTGLFAGREILLRSETKFPATFPLAFVYVIGSGEGTFKTAIEVLDPTGSQLLFEPLEPTEKIPHQNHVRIVKFAKFFAPIPGSYAAILTLDGHQFIRKFEVMHSAPE